jgi:gamma-glutamyltranspeptidase/glutathione hydrolase
MVAAMHPLATAAGLETLKAGGNAVDAAVAAGFATGVVEPFMSGVGGLCCMVIYRASDKSKAVVDGSARTPSGARDGMYELLDPSLRAGLYQWRATKDDANNTGYRSICVPGTPAALLLALERYGSLPRARVMEPAIRLAEDFIHPTVFTRDGPQMSGSMFTAFCASWGAVTLLAYLLYRVELTGKRVDADLRELREALE